ncbi:MAG: hypothetical protein Satyrvirus28_4 [Satyrvirus sp.]|uniref:Uncharacterized protein n=1 Tax=Satyrvirus sp. TaxID=2487771 RepID=A0A3G5AEJ9_9VIRU|nr:MAG: hypothetical protein Satyrvirus28_4 [Satyrvirus sp.]
MSHTVDIYHYEYCSFSDNFVLEKVCEYVINANWNGSTCKSCQKPTEKPLCRKCFEDRIICAQCNVRRQSASTYDSDEDSDEDPDQDSDEDSDEDSAKDESTSKINASPWCRKCLKKIITDGQVVVRY